MKRGLCETCEHRREFHDYSVNCHDEFCNLDHEIPEDVDMSSYSCPSWTVAKGFCVTCRFERPKCAQPEVPYVQDPDGSDNAYEVWATSDAGLVYRCVHWEEGVSA